MPIGVAIIGGGIFAREEHLPAVRSCPDLVLKAVYSRSLTSAKTLASDNDDVIELYSDDSGAGKQYDDLLGREDVQAVIIALPILVQPSFIRKALLAGKHVLSEKPIAKDVAEARELIAWYEEQKANSSTGATWSVAENFRYLARFLKAREVIEQQGRILGFGVRMHSYTKPGGKYFETEWRKKPQYQGGFLLDGGVHFAAGLRLLLGNDNAISRVSAFTAQLQPHLPPVDTLDASLLTESGITGTFSASFGTSFAADEWAVACEKGVVCLRDDVITVAPRGGGGGGDHGHVITQTVDYEPDKSSVAPEIEAWAAAMKNKSKPEIRQLPREALADLELLENMLQSGEKKGEPVACVLQHP